MAQNQYVEEFERLLASIPQEELSAFASSVHRILRDRTSQQQQQQQSQTSQQTAAEAEAEARAMDGDEDGDMDDGDIVDAVVRELKTLVTVSAEAPEEQTRTLRPRKDGGVLDGYDAEHTVHVDSFLFTDEDVDRLCDTGAMSRCYCLDCGSRKTAPLTFLSHSASRNQLEFVFGEGGVLGDIPKDAMILDVGSRLGAVMYVAWARTQAKEIIGVELSPFFVDVQRKMVSERFPDMQPRVKVVEGDIRSHPELLARADVIVLNNVFECFVEGPETELSLWSFVRRHATKSGCKIVAIPALEETASKFGSEGEALLDIPHWVKEVPIDFPDDCCMGDAGDDLSVIHLYTVL